MPSFFGRGVPEYPGIRLATYIRGGTGRCRRPGINGRSVVSAARAHLEILTVIGNDLDRAVVAVGLEVARLVRDRVLAAEFVLNCGEGVGDLTDLKREKGVPTGGVGDAFENSIAGTLSATHVSANGVDDGLGALRHLDRFFAGDMTLIVLAIAQQNNRAPYRCGLRGFHELVATCEIEGIVKRSAAARTQFVNPMREGFGVVGEILCHLRSDIESHYERGVLVEVDRLVQELDRGFLFKLKAVAHGVAGINQQSDLQRKVGFRVKAANLLWRLIVVEHLEIILFKIGDPSAVLVCYGEDDVNLVGGGFEGSEVLRVGGRRVCRLLVGRLRIAGRCWRGSGLSLLLVCIGLSGGCIGGGLRCRTHSKQRRQQECGPSDRICSQSSIPLSLYYSCPP